jgi:hypothetical protein
MFCPLCKSEYRGGVTHCESCLAALVESLDAPEAQSNGPVNFWSGKDDSLFDALTAALFAAGIPSRSEGPPRVFARRQWLPESKISILLTDFDRAMEAAKTALEPFEQKSQYRSMCYACRAMILPGFARCYRCGAVLHVPLESEPVTAKPAPKRCPVCGLTYGARYASCTRCGVELASRYDPDISVPDLDGEERLLVVWRGSDTAAFSRVEGALRGAGVAHHATATHDHLAFGMGIPRPMYEVRVLQSDFEAAKYLVAPIRETLPFEVRKPQTQEGGTDLFAIRPGGIRRYPKRNLSEAVVQVWSGDDPAIGNMLRACFFENRILLRTVGTTPGQREFYVCPDQEEAAREIVREITEGKVPE